MNKEFISYGKQWISKEDIDSVIEVLRSDFLTQGPKVNEFERSLCKYTGAKYCVVVSNGTAALHIAVASLGLSEGSEGITSTNTFVASSNSFVYNRLKPIFADIDKNTYNIDLGKIKNKITNKTKVIIPVHFAGQPVDVEAINKLVTGKNIYIVEDAAHAIGAKYKNGKKVGCCEHSDLTIFSFHPVKTITTGEGGAITTNNRVLYEKLLLLRSHGITKDKILNNKNIGPWYYEMQEIGFNYRLTDIQAALGISQLNKLDGFVHRRREIVKKYNEAFKNIEWLTTPFEDDGVFSAFHLYVLKINFVKLNKSKKMAIDILKNQNIGAQVHYIPVHTQPFYLENYGYKWGDYPVAEKYYESALSIPLYPKMSNNDVEYVINNIFSLEK